jgi:hypothetical protein
MADLFTHLVAARLPASALSHPRLVALFVIGTFLPDLAAKGLFWVARSAPGRSVPAHSILGVLLLSYTASLFIDSGLRGQAFWALFGGALVHIAVDLAKDNMGLGAAVPFDPFLGYSLELGWMFPDNFVLLFPLNAGVLLTQWIVERRLRRVHP